MKTKLAIAISVSLLSSVAIAAPAIFTISTNSPEITAQEESSKSKYSPIKSSQSERYIIEFTESSLATAMVKRPSNEQQKLGLFAKQKTEELSLIQQQQQEFSQTLKSESPAVQIEQSFNTLFNGVTISGKDVDLNKIANMPNVKNIYQEKMYHVNMDASLDRINIQAMWNVVSGVENAGKGIRVAIIDSGIRPENPMFADQGFSKPTTGMPTDDYCSTIDANFCNNKLIVARWSQPTFPVCSYEYMSPLDYGSHGTHVAGTAVGNKITTSYQNNEVELSGVAPAAYLMAYKALYSEVDCSGGGGSNIMLMEALEHAVNDGADVINNSWSGVGYGLPPESSPFKAMFEAAEAAGVVIVIAAGNDGGNGNRTIGCPACVESGITVANSTTGRVFANTFTVQGDEFIVVPANNPASILTVDLTAPIIDATVVDGTNITACDPFSPEVFKDSIAVISRGDCTFSSKADNLLDAGAVGMLMYNNQTTAPFSMYMPDATIPGFMVSKANGEALVAGLAGGEQGTINHQITRIVDPAFADAVAQSSSRGPNGNENILKPDLAAPGSTILSAASPDSDAEFSIKSGTSMASPHVAGAAALMTQLFPNWRPLDIKTALMSTAKTEGILDSDHQTPATPFDMGAGLMDLQAASNAVLTFDKASIAADSCVIDCRFRRTVYNKSNEATTWQLSANVGTVSPSVLEIPAGGTASFDYQLNTTYHEPNQWVFGKVMLSNASLQDAHLPVAVMAKHSSDSSLISTIETDANITVDQPFGIKAMVNNSILDDIITFHAYGPEGTQLISADDVLLKVTNGQQLGYEVNTQANVMTWVGRLALPDMYFTSAIGAMPSLIDDLGATPRDCGSSCDETIKTLTLPMFKYRGQHYNKVKVSTNGMIIIGDSEAEDLWQNLPLGVNDQLNNIVAPFWSDLDLLGSAPADEGGGSLAYSIINDGSDDWLAIEWNKAQLWGDTSGNTYTFSVWIRLGEKEQMLFSYINISTLPPSLTVGAENYNGTLAADYHYNGKGQNVNSDSLLTLNGSPAGRVEIDYKVKAIAINTGEADSVTLDEDTNVTLDVLANDNSGDKLARARLETKTFSAKAQRLIQLDATDALSQVSIVDEPHHGSVEVTNDDLVIYTPNANYFGSDEFSYTAQDANGLVNSATKVYVTVNGINDAPTVTAGSVTITAGEDVTLTAQGVDVDGDELTYNWIQTSGTMVNFENGTVTISFVAPEQAQTLVFEVKAFDASVESAASIITVTVTEDSEDTTLPPTNETPPSTTDARIELGEDNGASLGWLTLVLLPLAISRRRLVS